MNTLICIYLSLDFACFFSSQGLERLGQGLSPRAGMGGRSQVCVGPGGGARGMRRMVSVMENDDTGRQFHPYFCPGERSKSET